MKEKNKKLSLIKGLSIGALSVALLATVGTVFSVSYSSWQSYYETMVKEKEQYEKEHAPEVTTMKGISVKIKDGVGFYKNGKAKAIKSNFVVEGLYTIGNEVNQRDYTEELSDYTIEAPEDFTEKGGDVVFHYLKQEAEVDENGNEKKDEEGNVILKTVYDFTETITIDLVDVKPALVSITHNPYIVAYAEGDRFNRDGLAADIINNDGSTYAENVSLSLLSFPTNRLTLETTSVKVGFKFGESDEDVAYGEIPVKVMPKDEFTNGELESFTIEGDNVLEAGSSLNSYKPLVYGTYSSGNRILLSESQCKLSGLTGDAEFGKNYFITIASTENPNIISRVSLKTMKNLSTSEATVSGATKYEGYVKDFDNNDYIEFAYNSEKEEVVKFILDMSNGFFEFANNKFVTKGIDFSDFAYISINGNIKDTSFTFLGGGAFDYLSDAYANYQKVELGAYRIKKGENKIRVTFKESNTGKTSAFGEYVAGAISKLTITPNSSSQEHSIFGEYFNENANPTLSISQNTTWNNDLAWVYASTSDGEYTYFYSCKPGSSNVSIIKYDLNSNRVVASSAFFTLLNEDHTPLFIKDGYIYTTNNDGMFLRLPISFIGFGTAKFEVLPKLAFENVADNKKIKSAYFNQSTRQYALLLDSGLSYFDANGKHLYGAKSFKNGVKVTGDDSYLYVFTNKSNGAISPSIQIYNWAGEPIKTINPTNTIETMGIEKEKKGSTNVQSIVAMNGNLYFTMVRWSGGNNSSVYKITAAGESGASESVERLGLYEYISSCTQKDVSPKFNSSLFSDKVVQSQMDMYAHGICSDEENLYITTNVVSGDTVVKKFSLATGEYLGKTASFKRKEIWANSDYLMYKDGYVYVFSDDGVRRVNASDITVDNAPSFETNALTIEGIDGAKAGAYNATVNKMAIMANGKLNIIGGKSLKVEKSVSASSGLGMASDANYIYVFFEEKAVGVTAKFSVYDWSGNLIKANQEIKGISSEVITASNNVQGMAMVNGECYFMVSRWDVKSQIAKVTFDTSILG